MFLIKILVKLLFVLAFGLILYWAYATFILKQPIQWEKFDFVALQQTGGEALNNARILAENTWKDLSEKGKVLGDNIKADDQKSIPQETFEYARYLYCQQVVGEWEKLHASPSPSSVAPSSQTTPPPTP